MLFIKDKLIRSLRLCCSGTLLLNLAFGSLDLLAAECGVLKLQKNRSQGANIVKNSCVNTDELSVEAILQIQAGARLWLESESSLQDSGNFQIICQNKSSEPFRIKVNSAILPWISSDGTAQCNSWVNDRLECNGLDTEKKALFCAIAQIKKPPVAQTMERKTSITMRGLNKDKPLSDTEDAQVDINQWVSYIKPEIDLCRKLFQTLQPITLSWKIKASGEVTGTTIKEPGIDNQLADCAIEVIENFSFPLFNKDTQITFSF